MRTRLLIKISFIFIGLFCSVCSQICDTSKNLLGSALITCIYSNCPEDSSMIEYEDGCLRRKYIYFSCKDSGMFLYFNEKGDTLTKSFFKGDKTIGYSKQFFSANHPKRFISHNDSGKKHGWEVKWYENGNVKDSIYNQNDEITRLRSNFTNGKIRLRIEDVFANNFKTKTAVYYDTAGVVTGKVKNGNGTFIIWSDDAKTRWLETYENGEEVASRKLEPGEQPVLR